jgi:hypothetical protein
MHPQNKREVRRMSVKDTAVSVSIITWHRNVLSILDYMDQRGVENSDITATMSVFSPSLAWIVRSL